MVPLEAAREQTAAGRPQVTADPATGSVLDLVLARVRLRARRRVAWLAHLCNRPMADLFNSFDVTIQTCLGDGDAPEAESAWFEDAEEIQSLNAELDRVEQALAGEAGAGLSRLAEMFHLSQPEMDLLQTCLAPAVDPALGPLYGCLHHHPGRSYPTEPLAARLFGYGRRSLWSPGAPLAVWSFVSAGESTPGEPPPLKADPVVIDWLQGELRMDAALVGLVGIIQRHPPLDSWPFDAAVQLIKRGLDHQSALRIVVVGPPASGRRTFAAAVAAQFGAQALSIDTGQIGDNDWHELFMRTQRLAVIGGAALVWHGSGLQRTWPGSIAPAPIQFVACDMNEAVPSGAHLIEHRIELPLPTLEERRRLWEAELPNSAAWPANELETLATRYRLYAGDIASVSRRSPSSAREADEFARELTRHRLGDLARLLDCPFSWDDLVLPTKVREALEDFTFEARDRVTFWESPGARRLFPRGSGLVALFSGPPGTGKTMAAQVIAAELKLDLFRIDLATVVSKYIGETAKHLSRIFGRAARMNAVLLFDEADALFSKRTDVRDAHDRYANADTGYLLQLLEEYHGIVILATNKKQNIDPAFIRRVRYLFAFPRPEAAERLRIWRQLVGELSHAKTLKGLETTLGVLAEAVEFSGAQIKNVVLASIFVARRSRERLAMAHLVRGVERELEKEGRSLGTRERERLMRDG